MIAADVLFESRRGPGWGFVSHPLCPYIVLGRFLAFVASTPQARLPQARLRTRLNRTPHALFPKPLGRLQRSVERSSRPQRLGLIRANTPPPLHDDAISSPSPHPTATNDSVLAFTQETAWEHVKTTKPPAACPATPLSERVQSKLKKPDKPVHPSHLQ